MQAHSLSGLFFLAPGYEMSYKGKKKTCSFFRSMEACCGHTFIRARGEEIREQEQKQCEEECKQLWEALAADSDRSLAEIRLLLCLYKDLLKNRRLNDFIHTLNSKHYLMYQLLIAS